MKTFFTFFAILLLSFSAFAQKSAKEYFTSGNAKFKAGNFAEAIKDYDQVLKLDPDHVVTLTNRGIAKDRLLDYRAAIEDFTKAITLNPKYIVAYTSRGLSKYNLKDYRSALLDYNKALELNPKDAKAYNNRGLVRYGLKDYSGAIEDYTKAISLKPNYAEALYNRGAPQYSLGENAKACSDWTKANSLGIKEASLYLKNYCGPASDKKIASAAPVAKEPIAPVSETKPESNKIDFRGMFENATTKVKSWFESEKEEKKAETASKKAVKPTASKE